MEKITFNEFLKQGSVVENLKNFVGLTAENSMGLMTPERLAAVAGELITEKMKGFGTFYSFTVRSKSTEMIDIAKDCISAIPISENVISFNMIHTNGVVHNVIGFIYPKRNYGLIEVLKFDNSRTIISIENSEYIIK